MKIDDFSHWVLDRQQEVERALERWVPDVSPAGLGSVMRYAVLDGGKRLRPLLVFLSTPEGDEPSIAAGVAVELVHMATPPPRCAPPWRSN